MKQFVLAGALAALSCVGSAATFSSGIGAGDVTSTIPGDYATLKDAADDFSNYAGAVAGNWTLTIGTDLTEPANVRFANNVPVGRTVTVKPASGVSPTVTFTQPGRNGTTGVIWDGHIVIGVKELTGANANLATNFTDTDNFTIDGSNNGTSSRDLTLTYLAPTPDTRHIMVHILGKTDNVTVKNCIIDHPSAGVTDNINVQVSARKDASANNLVPQNPRIENCELSAQVGEIGQAVKVTRIGTTDAGQATAGAVVTKNTIRSGTRAVFFEVAAGGVISNNTIATSTTASQRPNVIVHNGTNGTTGWTLDILRNNINNVVSGTQGGILSAMQVGGGLVSPNTGTINIRNNMISGFEYPVDQPSATGWLYRAITIENTTNTGVYNVEHNSINMPNVTGPKPQLNNQGDPAQRLHAISFYSAGGFAGTFNFRNNIVRMTQEYASVIASRPSPTGQFDIPLANLNFADNHYYYAGTGVTFAKVNETTYTTLADWKGIGKDAGSTDGVDPLAVVAGGNWRSATDLHFDAEPAGAPFAVAVLPSAGNDIDNEVRPNPETSQVEKGADEYYFTVIPTAAKDWSLFY